MKSKREPSKRKSRNSRQDKEWDLIESLKDNPQFREIAEEIMNPKKASEEELHEEEMLKFRDSIHELPASLEPPADFVTKWDNLLDWHAEKERDWFWKKTGKPHTGNRLVQRRWAVLDRGCNAYDYLEKRPSSEQNPIPIIVVNWFGTWDISESLRAAVIQHPVYRALAAELPEATPKNNLLHLLQWAMSLSGKETEEERLLASLAHECDALLHDVDIFDFPEAEWLREARKKDDFWKLLETVFNLGRRHAFWQTYRDGTVSKASRKGLLMAEKGMDSWSALITEILCHEHKQSGTFLTALQIRKKLGANLPSDADTKLEFTDPRCTGLPEITWPRLQERVKEAKARLRNNWGI